MFKLKLNSPREEEMITKDDYETKRVFKNHLIMLLRILGKKNWRKKLSNIVVFWDYWEECHGWGGGGKFSARVYTMLQAESQKLSGNKKV